MPRERPQPEPFEPSWLERSLNRYLLAGVVFMVALIVGFVGYRVREPSLRADAARTQRADYTKIGQQLFEASCAECHGADATGGGTAPTLNSKQFLSSTSDAQIHALIAGGISGTAMPAWSIDFGGTLTDEQVSQVVTYLRSLSAHAPSVPTWRQSGMAASGAGAGSAGAPGQPSTAPASKQAKVPTVNVTLSDTQGLAAPMTLTVAPASVNAGKVTFVVKNTGTILHEMIVLRTSTPFDQLPIVDGGDPPAPVASGANKVSETPSVGETGDVPRGTTKSVTLTLKKGSYVLVCNVAQHYGLGMRAVFTVM
jgi:mono/diheme cytochrome c family protein